MAQVLQSGGVLAALFSKHQNSRQPESQQLCAVMSAILEVLDQEKMQATPTAVFAAVMSSLEKPETQGSPEVRCKCGAAGCQSK